MKITNTINVDVREITDNLLVVDNTVEGIDDRVKDVDDKVKAIGDKSWHLGASPIADTC
jgi:hypothetical protein